MKTAIVIPARYASTRLPGKPLLEIAGKPMILHVYQRALESAAGEVWVATDDARIARAVEQGGGRVHVTGIGKPEHVARYAASVLSSTGTPATFLHGTEVRHGSAGQVVSGDDTVIACRRTAAGNRLAPAASEGEGRE